MAIYIDRSDCPDVNNISDRVISYIIQQHQQRLPRLEKLHSYYLAKNPVPMAVSADVAPAVVDLPKYTVDTLLGYYLGDPVKYTTNDDPNSIPLYDSVKATVKNGEVIRISSLKKSDVSIAPILRCYDRQSISEVDSQLGKHLGIYGEAYELLYASADEEPYPKSFVVDPRFCEMVRDTSIDHNKLFFFCYDLIKGINGITYYRVYIYTNRHVHEYRSSSLVGKAICSSSLVGKAISTNRLTYSRVKKPVRHFFGEVPAIEYQNGSDRLADFEPAISIVDKLNALTTERCLDKSKYVDSVLALFGYSISDDELDRLKKEKFIDSIPVDGRLEYVQKSFDEASVHVLADDLKRYYHTVTGVVDLQSDLFAGNSSGQALKLKFFAMNTVVRSKIRSVEKGLRKRFEMYNYWLNILGIMPELDRDDFTPVFTLSLPVDEQSIVNTVKQLRGIVDDETLLSQLWFVRDPKAVLEKVKKQVAEGTSTNSGS